MKHLTLRQRIADFERTVVRQTDDISRPCLVDGSLALRHKLRGRRETHGLAMTHMQVGRITGELAGTYLAECDT